MRMKPKRLEPGSRVDTLATRFGPRGTFWSRSLSDLPRPLGKDCGADDGMGPGEAALCPFEPPPQPARPVSTAAATRTAPRRWRVERIANTLGSAGESPRRWPAHDWIPPPRAARG